MFAKGKINKKLLTSYLTGNCPNADKIRVEQWISASVKNAELFRQFESVWAYTAPVASMPEFDSKQAMMKVRNRIQMLENKQHKIPVRKPAPVLTRRIVRYAASVAAVLLIAFTTFFALQTTDEIQHKTFVAETKVLEPVVLPDGSRVYLNSGSSLSYPEKFAGNFRNVILDGEAFFEVSSDPAQPFVVVSGNLGVKVLGTSFNFNTCTHLHTAEVAIHSGEVLFYSFDQLTGNIREQIVLASGEKGIYHKNEGSIIRSLLGNNNSIGWKSGSLEFNNTPLQEVVVALESTYNLHFECERNLDGLVLTARFNQEEADNVLETLQLIFGFRIEKSDNLVRIF